MLSHRSGGAWIGCEVTLIQEMFDGVIINVYGPCDTTKKRDVWDEISRHVLTIGKPCFIIGDFNEVLSADERGSSIIDKKGVEDFKDLIYNLQLIEIRAGNGKFTWFRGKSKSKLDRVLVQADWLVKIPSLRVTLLNRSVSDHCPVLTSDEMINWGPKPFRFLDCWLSHEGCLKVAKEAWLANSSLSIMDKLKGVKAQLKKWNLEEFGNIKFMISDCEQKIQRLDSLANNRDLSEDEMAERNKASADLWTWLRRQVQYWRQLSRNRWIKDGDRNTNFFHTVASSRHRRNELRHVSLAGSVISEPLEVKRTVRDFFQNVFSEEPYRRPVCNELEWPRLSDQSAEYLISEVNEEEIARAVQIVKDQEPWARMDLTLTSSKNLGASSRRTSSAV